MVYMMFVTDYNRHMLSVTFCPQWTIRRSPTLGLVISQTGQLAVATSTSSCFYWYFETLGANEYENANK